MKRLGPIKRVREKCLDCSGQSRKDVRECQFEECPFYSLRMGRGGRARLKKIRSHCLWCCNGQKGEIRACPFCEMPDMGIQVRKKTRKLPSKP